MDPAAEDETPPVITFRPPTPRNGSVVPGPVTVRAEMDEPGTLRILVSRNGGGFRDHTSEAQLGKRDVELSLGEIEEGAWSVRIEGVDAAGNRADRAFTAFVIDRSPPVLKAVRWTPEPAIAGGSVIIRANFIDEPFQEIRDLSIDVKTGGAGTVTVSGKPPLTWIPGDREGQALPPGNYPWTATVTDWAGHRSRPISGTLRIVKGDEVGLKLTLDPVRSRTTSPRISIVARTRKGVEVELTVNGRPSQRAFASGSGRVKFNRVALDPGLNRIRAVARDLRSGIVSSPREARVTRIMTVTTGGGGKDPGDGDDGTPGDDDDVNNEDDD